MDFFLFIFLGILYLCSALMVVLDWMALMFNREHVVGWFYRVIEIIVTLFTLIAFWLSREIIHFPFDGRTILSPEFFYSIYFVTGCVVLAYFYCIYRRSVSIPVVEVLLNGLLISGIGLCILVSVILAVVNTWVFCILPVWLLILALRNNHRRLYQKKEGDDAYDASDASSGEGIMTRFCRDLLLLPPGYKYPVLSVIGLGMGLLISLPLEIYAH